MGDGDWKKVHAMTGKLLAMTEEVHAEGAKEFTSFELDFQQWKTGQVPLHLSGCYLRFLNLNYKWIF